MPFTYPQPQPNPYVASISDLMLRQGDLAGAPGLIAAQGKVAQADISSRNASNLAGIVAAIPGQLQQADAAKQKSQLTQLAINAGTDAESTRKGFIDLLRNTPNIPVEAGGPFNVPDIVKGMAAQGLDPTAAGQHLNELNQTFQQAETARMAVVQRGAAAIAVGGNDPALAGHFLDTLEKTGIFPKDQIDKFRSVAQTHEGVASLTAYLMGPQKMENAAAGSMARNPVTGQVVPGSQVPDKENEWDIALKAANGDPLKAIKMVHPDRVPTEAGLAVAAVQDAVHPDGTPLTDAEKSALALTKMRPFVLPTAGSSEDVVTRALDIAKEKNNGQPLSAQQVQDITLKAREQYTAAGRADADEAPVLTPEALKLTARQFAMTGQLPPMGMGKAGAQLRTKIINQAAEEFKGLDLPTQIASYKANQSSLIKLQGTADKVAAFESTAGKNLNQFLSLADKIPDVGVPWLNQPVRLLNDVLVGSENQAAFNAARDVALREIARVTNDPNLSGVLSDSARHEVQGLSPQSATFAQIKKVSSVLLQDMANVKSSLNEQIGSIQQRIATLPGGSPSGPEPEFIFNPATGKAEPVKK